MKSKLKPVDINSLIGYKLCTSIPMTVRENQINAKTHDAKNMAVFVFKNVELSALPYVVVVTDADPFEDENSIKDAHKPNTGDTGIQGSGLISSEIALASVGGTFNGDVFQLITFSHNSFLGSCGVDQNGSPVDQNGNPVPIGFVVVSTVSRAYQDMPVFELLSEGRADMLPFMKKVIGGFKFKNPRTDKKAIAQGFNDGRPTVIHFFRLGDYNSYPLSGEILAACQEFTNFEGIDAKFCYRNEKYNNSSTDENMNTVFNLGPGQKNLSNRLSSGVTAEDFEALYSLCSISKDVDIDYEFSTNGRKVKVNAQANCRIVLFPGLCFKKNNNNSLVTLYVDEEVNRKVGAKGGHDLLDSGHRILVSFDSYKDGVPCRPTGEPVFSVHDSSPNRPSNYTSNTLGFKAKEVEAYHDAKDFIQRCREFEEAHNVRFKVDYDKVISDEENIEHYVRYPFMKIQINVKSSTVSYDDISLNFLGDAPVNGCWVVTPWNGEKMRRLIVGCLESFRTEKKTGEESHEFSVLKQIYKLLFPKEFETGTHQVPLSDLIGESSGPGRFREKIEVFLRSKKEVRG